MNTLPQVHVYKSHPPFTGRLAHIITAYHCPEPEFWQGHTLILCDFPAIEQPLKEHSICSDKVGPLENFLTPDAFNEQLLEMTAGEFDYNFSQQDRDTYLNLFSRGSSISFIELPDTTSSLTRLAIYSSDRHAALLAELRDQTFLDELKEALNLGLRLRRIFKKNL